MKKLVFVIAAAAMLAACTQNKGWKVSGTVANAPADSKVAVQRFNGAMWYTIDSVSVGADGSFAYQAQEGSQYPDVYRLSLNGQNIYFPIDSIEAVTVEADAASFGSGYTLGGSALAEQMMQVDRDLAAHGADSVFKRELNTLMLNDSVGVISYYLINKTIGGRPLYDPANRSDLRMIGAIANKFDNLFPSDPRTKYLAQRFIEARKQLAAATEAPTVIEAPEVSLFDIDLYDNLGQKQSLKAVAEHHPVVILSFTSYEIEPSLAYNVELNKVYEKRKASGLEIYQVAFDDDENNWHTAAGNLPWMTVHAAGPDMQNVMAVYNVFEVPTTFIIKDGAVVERVLDATELASAVAKY